MQKLRKQNRTDGKIMDVTNDKAEIDKKRILKGWSPGVLREKRETIRGGIKKAGLEILISETKKKSKEIHQTKN